METLTRIDDNVYRKYSINNTFDIVSTVETLEKLLGGTFHYYKDIDYPDDDYKTDYSIAGHFNNQPFCIYNYKTGHYIGRELSTTEPIYFSVRGTEEFKKWLNKHINE